MLLMMEDYFDARLAELNSLYSSFCEQEKTSSFRGDQEIICLNENIQSLETRLKDQLANFESELRSVEMQLSKTLAELDTVSKEKLVASNTVDGLQHKFSGEC